MWTRRTRTKRRRRRWMTMTKSRSRNDSCCCCCLDSAKKPQEEDERLATPRLFDAVWLRRASTSWPSGEYDYDDDDEPNVVVVAVAVAVDVDVGLAMAYCYNCCWRCYEWFPRRLRAMIDSRLPNSPPDSSSARHPRLDLLLLDRRSRCCRCRCRG